MFWGLVAGSLLGVLLLWALLAALVLPGEARTVRSLGDGKPSDDDLCISGSTKLVEWAQKARHLAQLLRSIESPNASVGERLAGIQALKCATPAR